jgi:hypothetical protein
MSRIITPCGHQVLVRKRDNKRTASGLHLPESQLPSASVEGEVLAVGPGDFDTFYANLNYGPDWNDESLSAAERKQLAAECVLPRYKPMPCKVGDLVIVEGDILELEDGMFLCCASAIMATFVVGAN